ncbi:MAG: hypothetical protein IE890_01545 [Arcobacter sp.]|nr:hypothetical protein [Arcobacter sp.]
MSSELDIIATEQMYDEYALDEEMHLHQEHLDAIAYIEQFASMVKKEEDYADLIEAKGEVVEYKEVYAQYEQYPSESLKKQLEEMGQSIILLTKHLKEKEIQIPLSEKKKITVKDFEFLYSIPEETQRRLRRREGHPLPHYQIMERGNILYDPKEVDKWMENYKKERK